MVNIQDQQKLSGKFVDVKFLEQLLELCKLTNAHLLSDVLGLSSNPSKSWRKFVRNAPGMG